MPPQHSAGEVTGVTQELEESRSQDDVLAGELLLHQGGVRHQVLQDGGVDGQCGDGDTEGLRLQGLHICRIQKRKGQLPRNNRQLGVIKK